MTSLVRTRRENPDLVEGSTSASIEVWNRNVGLSFGLRIRLSSGCFVYWGSISHFWFMKSVVIRFVLPLGFRAFLYLLVCLSLCVIYVILNFPFDYHMFPFPLFCLIGFRCLFFIIFLKFVCRPVVLLEFRLFFLFFLSFVGTFIYFSLAAEGDTGHCPQKRKGSR